MICKSDFARGRVTALQNYWKEIDWKYYSIYQLNYDFVGITEFEAAFWWKLLQRIYHNNEYYQQTFIEIRQKFYDKSLDEKVFDNDEVKMGNYRFFLNSCIYDDMHQINWTVLQQLHNPNFKLYQDVEKIKQYLLRTIPGTNDELLTPDDFDIRVEDYYNDFVSGGIESAIIELDDLIDCFERLGKENYQNIPTFFTIVCIRLALNGIKWLDFQKAKPDLLNFIKWCEENKIKDMDKIRNIEDVSKNLAKFAEDKKKSLSSWISS